MRDYTNGGKLEEKKKSWEVREENGVGNQREQA